MTLIILRASVNLLNTSYAQVFATNSVDSDAWDFLGVGSVLGIPINAATLFVVLLICHIFLSRSRYGWHLTAIGASRKAARHAGIRVRLILFFTYVLSGTLCAASGIFYAARQSSTDSTTGVGWEFQALTAVVLGGVSLAGGKGTVWRAMIGALIIFLLINGLVRMGIPGYVTSAVIGIILLAAVGIDVKWSKNRGKAIQKIYVNPAFVAFAPAPSVQPGCASPYAQNDRLINAQAIGLDQVEGPEDVILDRQDRVYGSTRDGNIIRFSGPNFETARGFRAYRRPAARHAVRPRREPDRRGRRHGRLWRHAGRARCSRSPTRPTAPGTSSTTNSRLRMADDLDIAPDGKIYFSDCTTRYEMTTNTLDILEARPNGRLVCYDPGDQDHAHRHQSFLFPERRLRLARRQVAADRQHLAVQDLPLLARGSEAGPDRGPDRRAAGQPRQHQPRLRRQPTGWRWSASAPRPSTSPRANPASGCAWSSRCRPTNGWRRRSIMAAC